MGSVPQHLAILCQGLQQWMADLRNGRGGQLNRFHHRVMAYNLGDRDDENILDLLTAKLDLNLEIDKEELYWE